MAAARKGHMVHPGSSQNLHALRAQGTRGGHAHTSEYHTVTCTILLCCVNIEHVNI